MATKRPWYQATLGNQASLFAAAALLGVIYAGSTRGIGVVAADRSSLGECDFRGGVGGAGVDRIGDRQPGPSCERLIA